MKLGEKRSENDTCEQVGAGELREKIIMSHVNVGEAVLQKQGKNMWVERKDRRNGKQERRRRGQL